MKRNTNFLIAIVAAMITFGSLTLVFGPKHSHWRSHHNGWHRMHHHEHDSCNHKAPDDKS